MPYVRVRRFHGKRLHISDEDMAMNGVGYLVRKHWVAWIGFAIEMALMFTVFAAGVWIAVELELDLIATKSLWVFGIAVAFMAKYAWVAYMERKNEYILITPANVFYSRMEYWFKHVVYPLSVGETTLRAPSLWTAGIPDIRTVHLNTEGDASDYTMHLAAGGDEIMTAWQKLTAPAKD